MSRSFARWFRFFDALTVRLEGDLRSGAACGFHEKFKHYELTHNPGAVDVTFRVGPFVIPEGSKVRRFNDYRITHGTLGNARRYKLARYRYEISGLDGLRWTIRLHGDAPAQRMMHHLVMTSWLQIALSARGFVPVHAAAVAHPDHPDRAVLLAGRRGVGKTTLVGRLLGKGYHVVSEDRVFVKGGVVYGLRVPVNMKFDRDDPGLSALPAQTKRRLRAKAALAKATRGYIALHEPVDPAALLPGRLVDRCALRRVVYLQSGPGLSVESADPGATAERIVLGNRFDDPAVVEDVLAYRYCFDDFSGHNELPWERDQSALHGELSRSTTRCAGITIPVTPTEAQWESVIGEVVA